MSDHHKVIFNIASGKLALRICSLVYEYAEELE